MAQIGIQRLLYTSWFRTLIEVMFVLDQDHYNRQIETGIAGIYVVWKQFVLNLHDM